MDSRPVAGDGISQGVILGSAKIGRDISVIKIQKGSVKLKLAEVDWGNVRLVTKIKLPGRCSINLY